MNSELLQLLSGHSRDFHPISGLVYYSGRISFVLCMSRTNRLSFRLTTSYPEFSGSTAESLIVESNLDSHTHRTSGLCSSRMFDQIHWLLNNKKWKKNHLHIYSYIYMYIYVDDFFFFIFCFTSITLKKHDLVTGCWTTKNEKKNHLHIYSYIYMYIYVDDFFFSFFVVQQPVTKSCFF